MIRLALVVLSLVFLVPQTALAAKGGRWLDSGVTQPGKSKKHKTTEVDTLAPVISVPDQVAAEAQNSSGSVVNFSVTSKDDVDGPIKPVCTPASGSLFAIGTSVVTCQSTDAAGNASSASFNVMVSDSTAPQILVPPAIVTESLDGNPVLVTYSASATDSVDGTLDLNCAPSSASLFSIGETTVACDATDTAGNTRQSTFLVTVNDATPLPEPDPAPLPEPEPDPAPEPEPAPDPTPAPYFSVNIDWQIPTVRADGTPLTLAELAEYAIVYDSDPSLANLKTLTVPSFDNTGQPISALSIPDLPAGMYYFAIAAVDTNGMASNFSEVVAVNLQ